MPAKPVEFIQPPNNLRMKQKLAGVSMSFDGSAVDQAEASIRRCSDDFFVSIAEDLAKMQRRYEGAMLDPESRPVAIEDIHAVGQAVAGQGSSFNYPLLTALGSQLCHYIEDHVFPLAGVRGVTDSEMEVVKVHQEAMRLIVQQKMEGDGGPTGQKIVAGLGLVIKKVTGHAPGAQAS